MIPDPVSDTGHPHPEAITGTSPGGTTGIVITPGERVADPWAEGHHPPAIGPWKLAARRLRRNYVAQAFLVLFLLIVVACLLAPFYASHIAHIGPNTNNVTGTINIGGKTTDVVSPDGVPIGPTFSSRYFFGADSNGRDLAVRLLYGGRTSLLIGGIATVIIIVFGALAGLLTGYFRGVTDMILRPLMELIWSFPVVILGVALGTALALGGIGPVKGNSLYIPALIIGVVFIPYLGKPIRGEVLRLREHGFRRSGPGAGDGLLADHALRDPAQPRLDDHRVRADDAGVRDPAGGLPVVPGSGGAGAERVVGDADLRRAYLYPDHSDILPGPGGHAGADRAQHQRRRRRHPGRARPPRPGKGADLMARFIVRRMASAILLLFAVSIVVFAIFEVIPSYNPARAIAGRNATPTTVAEVSHKFGFDKPVYVQYANTMELIFTGQVIDYNDNLNVDSQFAQRFPVTVSLVVPAALLWLVASVVLGSISALRVGGLADRGLMVAAILGVSIPVFLLAAVLLYLFAFKLPWFPNTGYVPLPDNPAQWAYHLFLPWISIAILSIGFYSRVLRSNLLDMVNEDFVRTARAKGLPRRQVFRRHVLRNSLMPIVTMFGLDFAVLLGGAALVTETVFNLPGIGQYEAQAIGNLDVPPILVGAMFTAFFVVLFGAFSDIVYALLDPRVRLTG